MPQLLGQISSLEIKPSTILDVGLTALLIYGLFSLIRDTRAVRLVIGVILIYGIYIVAQLLGLQLLTQILQAGAVVGAFALVVVFQPELRRALERLGRVGSLGWLLAPGPQSGAELRAATVATAAGALAAERHGALIVIERETGLEDTAETGVMVQGVLSGELLRTIFMPRSPLHDGAVIVRGDDVLAAGVVLPLADGHQAERLGTRHRAAIGLTQETDAVVVVVSEETGGISLVERGRIVRNLDEDKLRVALTTLLHGAPSRQDGTSASGARGPRRPRLRPRGGEGSVAGAHRVSDGSQPQTGGPSRAATVAPAAAVPGASAPATGTPNDRA